MSLGFIFAFLFLSFSTWAQTLSPKDPCFNDYQSKDCTEKVRKNIFFVTGVGGEVRAEYDRFLNAFFNRHGIKGFGALIDGPQKLTLLEYYFTGCTHKKFSQKLIHAFPRGEKIAGKNIYQLVIGQYPPFTRSADFDHYIHNLNLLFPENGNGDYRQTAERFGLLWGDSLFAAGYLERIKNAIKSIDNHNEFFNKNDLQPQKRELEKVALRLEALAQLPQKACAIASVADYEALKASFGDLVLSSALDIPECLLKHQRFGLLKHILLKEPALDDHYPRYFDQVVDLVSTPESFELGEYLYAQMVKRGQKIIPRKGEGKRVFLERVSVYLARYGEERLVCDSSHFQTGVLENLNRNMHDIIFLHAFEIMQKMVKERDLVKKQLLMDQFAEIHALGVQLDRLHPQTGQGLMHLVAEAGDEWVYAHLHPRIDSYAIGGLLNNRNGEAPVDVALKFSSLSHMKLARRLFKESFSSYEDLKRLRKQLRKMKSKDKAYEAVRHAFLEDVKIELWE